MTGKKKIARNRPLPGRFLLSNRATNNENIRIRMVLITVSPTILEKSGKYSVSAVSYTHLDVYKRQASGGMTFSISQASAAL